MIFLALTWFLVCIPKLSTAACSCNGFKSLQEQFCEVDFVVGVTILEQNPAGNKAGDKKYMVQVIDVFKGNPVGVNRRYNVRDVAYLYTPATEELGAILLLPSNHYVVGGEIKDGKNWIGKCCLNYPGYGLPCNASQYIEGCKSCKIKRCGPNFCSYGYFSCRYRSEDTYADACVMGPSGCTWEKCNKMTILSESYKPAEPPLPPNHPLSHLFNTNIHPPANVIQPVIENTHPPPSNENMQHVANNPPPSFHENEVPPTFIDPYYRSLSQAPNNQQYQTAPPTDMPTKDANLYNDIPTEDTNQYNDIPTEDTNHHTTQSQGVHFWFYNGDEK